MGARSRVYIGERVLRNLRDGIIATTRHYTWSNALGRVFECHLDLDWPADRWKLEEANGDARFPMCPDCIEARFRTDCARAAELLKRLIAATPKEPSTHHQDQKMKKTCPRCRRPNCPTRMVTLTGDDPSFGNLALADWEDCGRASAVRAAQAEARLDAARQFVDQVIGIKPGLLDDSELRALHGARAVADGVRQHLVASAAGSATREKEE